MDWIKNNRLSLLLIAVIIGLLLCAWTFWPRPKPAVGISEPLPAAKEVRTVEKIVYRPKLIYVYPDKVKAKLNLPAPITKDQTKKVLATGKLETDERDYSLSTVLDANTGESQIYAKPLPLPLIGPGKHGAIGIGYGLSNGGASTKVYGYQELLRIKSINTGVRAEADQSGRYWAGIYAEYRW